MEQNELFQWSVVGIIVLLAIIWVFWRILSANRRSGSGCNCGGCSESSDCKAKELRDLIEARKIEAKKQSENCRDGQSARN